MSPLRKNEHNLRKCHNLLFKSEVPGYNVDISKGEFMNSRWTKRLMALSLGATVVCGYSLPVHGEQKTTVQTVKDNPEIPSVDLFSSTLYDSQLRPVPIGSDPNTPVSEILDQIGKGEASAVKGGVFVSEEDAVLGIVQLTFNIAGKENESEQPVNVLLILDQTGSMNMYSSAGTTFFMDCLNPDHMYYIPAGTFGNHGAGYIRIADYNSEGPVFKDWYGTDENGKDYVAGWVVKMLNSLPKTAEESDENAEDIKTEPDSAEAEASEAEKKQSAEKEDLSVSQSEKRSSDVQEQSKNPKSGVSEQNEADADSDAILYPASDAAKKTEELNTKTPSAEEPAADHSAADPVQTEPLSGNREAEKQSQTDIPAADSEDGEQKTESRTVTETVIEYEEVEEWVEVEQEPVYETVTETVLITPEPETVTETQTVLVPQEPVLDEETGEMIERPPVEQEITIEKTVTPEPYETTVEKQVLKEQEPVYEKIVKKVPVEKTVEKTEEILQQTSQQKPEETASTVPDEPESADSSSIQPAESIPAQSEQDFLSDGSDEKSAAGPKAQDSESEQPELPVNETADLSEENDPEEKRSDEKESLPEEEAGEETPEQNTEDRVYDSPYNVNYFTVSAWNPNNNHYHVVNGSYVKIPQPAQIPQSVNGFDPDYHFYSPQENNEAGCYDRAMLSKQYAREFARSLFQQNPNNRIAVEIFNNQQETAFRTDFTSDYSKLESILDFTDGGDNTNYELAFTEARSLVEQSEGFMKNRPLYTIFVSDGQPNRSLSKEDPALSEEYAKAGGFNFYTGIQAADQFKSEVPQILYAAGLQTNIQTYLSKLASKPEYARDCRSMEEFRQFLHDVAASWQREHPRNGELEDVIANGFTLLISKDHPFVMDGTAYTAKEQLPAAVKIDGQKITISLGTLTEQGRNISFFVQAAPQLLANSSRRILYPTNSQASLRYDPVIIKDGNLEFGPQTSVELKTPYAEFSNSRITARKSSDKENQKLKPGDEITYTIDLTNTGLLDLDHLYVSDAIPEGTEYVSGGTFRDGTVYFDLKDLKAGTVTSVRFTVRVKDTVYEDGIDRIENMGYFGHEPGPDGKPDLPTNEVENPLEPEPEPQPEPEPGPQPEPQPVPKTEPETTPEHNTPVTAVITSAEPVKELFCLSLAVLAAAGIRMTDQHRLHRSSRIKKK